MKEEVRVLIDEEKVAKRVKELAEQINRDYEGKKIHMICILKGSVFFTCELAKYIKVPVSMDFMSVSSYGDGLTSSGCITINQDLTMNIEGKEVLLVEDIVDSGRTLSYLAHMLQKRNPASLKICTLLDKPQCRVAEVESAYTGFEIEDLFVVGFGLDYAQRYRNLPYIGELIIKED
ncbi:MAG: hypoxanthine phosphoribosyltransferase [Lachnospiraceae bacterium]|nr:hypoxanthine phosphoribosyltransferase [Lachnospiraceae bacterium]